MGGLHAGHLLGLYRECLGSGQEAHIKIGLNGACAHKGCFNNLYFIFIGAQNTFCFTNKGKSIGFNLVSTHKMLNLITRLGLKMS